MSQEEHAAAALDWQRIDADSLIESVLVNQDGTVLMSYAELGRARWTCKSRVSGADIDQAASALRKLGVCRLRQPAYEGAMVRHQLRISLGKGHACEVLAADQIWRRQPKLVAAEDIMLRLRRLACGGDCPSVIPPGKRRPLPPPAIYPPGQEAPP